MAKQVIFEQFLYQYSIFLFFIVFIIGLGAGTYIGGNIESLTAPEPPSPPEPSGNAVWDFLTGTVGSGVYFIQNIVFFFQLMTIDVAVGGFGIVIFSPAIIFLLYGIIKLIRGGG